MAKVSDGWIWITSAAWYVLGSDTHTRARTCSLSFFHLFLPSLSSIVRSFVIKVFGKIRYAGSNESAIYGDYAEATDAGKIGDIDEIPPGKNELKFTLLLQPGKEDAKLEFINPKIRVYPGMSKDFRIMKPVSDTMDVCDPDYDLCD